MANNISEEIKSLRKIIVSYVGVSITIIVLIVGGWARAEVRISNNVKDYDYLREHSLNKDAFTNYLKIDKVHDESILIAIKDENTKRAIEYFNKEKQSIIDVICASMTEIRPRGTKIENNNKLQK